MVQALCAVSTAALLLFSLSGCRACSSGAKVLAGLPQGVKITDPDHRLPFAIENDLLGTRELTARDLEIKAVAEAEDKTLWLFEQSGPMVLHADATGKLLAAPLSLPDPGTPGRPLRGPASPFLEEGSMLRIMRALQMHATANGSKKAMVLSPWYVNLTDGVAVTTQPDRDGPPPQSGLRPATSEYVNLVEMQGAGFDVITWTVNEKPLMLALMKLGVKGIISDSPNLLREAVEEFDANGDGKGGDLLDADGLVDLAKFDAQGHRGGRNLRPENTLPAFEVALDSLMATIETDGGVTKDGIIVHGHEHFIRKDECRRLDGQEFQPTLIKDLALAELQSQFVCDVLKPSRTEQKNDLALSPVAVKFAEEKKLPQAYTPVTLQQLFDFVNFYAAWYKTGPGATHADALRRAKNAERIHFNIETKLNPREAYKAQTQEPQKFVEAMLPVIIANKMEDRAIVQSFDAATLLIIHRKFPQVRTSMLIGDFPIFSDANHPDSGDGTNLQDDGGANTPWLGGLRWPYRVSAKDTPITVSRNPIQGIEPGKGATILVKLTEAPAGAASTLPPVFTLDLEKGVFETKAN